MAARSSIDQLPPELLMDILSQLSWKQQLGVRRVSHQWLEVVDACLAHRQELDINSNDRSAGLNTERLLSLLQSMPALRRLCIEDEFVKYKIRRSLVVGLISVDQMCDNCPQLQEVSLYCQLDDADVETLLRRLPGLRSLHLNMTVMRGKSLSLLPAALQSLSLYASQRIKSVSLRHLTRCPQLRDLDLSHTKVRSEDLAAASASWPQLERLVVDGCHMLTGDWLSALRPCSRLRDLDLSDTTVRSEELAAAVVTCPQLERLAVN